MKIISLLLLIALCGSCHIQNGSPAVIGLKKDTVINFSTTPYTKRKSLSYYTENKRAYIVNANSNTIEFYDMDTRLPADTIILDKEKFSDLSKEKFVYRLFILNRDSIFVCPPPLTLDSFSMYLANAKGEMVKNLRMGDDTVYKTAKEGYIIVPNFSPPLYAGGKLYAAIVFPGPPWLNGKSAIITIDVGSNAIRHVVFYPEQYNKKYYSTIGSLPSFTLNNKKQLVVSFPTDHAIYVYEQDAPLVNKHFAPSKYLPDEFPALDTSGYNTGYTMTPAYSDRADEYVVTLGHYQSLLYDPYRNLYYRVARHLQDYKNGDGTINKMDDKTWSLMVLDSSFRVLGEQIFPPKIYKDVHIFVTREGLLISNDHELNPAYRDTVISFTLFKIMKDGKAF